MARTLRALVSLSLVLPATMGVVVTATPAAAGVGKGPALIRLDVPSATVTKIREGSESLQRITLAPGSSGQWLGERPDSRGVLRTTSGDMTARTLLRAWGKLGYADGIGTTITWRSGGRLHSAFVELRKPKLTPRGRVALTFSSETSLPASIKNATLNIQRSGTSGARAFPYYARGVLLSGSLMAQVTVTNAYTSMTYFYCGPTVYYRVTLTQFTPLFALPDPLSGCDPILKSGQVTMVVPTSFASGFVLLQATLQPSYGNPMPYSSHIATWTMNGG